MTAPVPEPFIVANEFAVVKVTLDRQGRGPRLHLTDMTSGDTCYLDPIVLSSLCQWPPDELRRLLEVGDYVDTPDAGDRRSSRQTEQFD